MIPTAVHRPTWPPRPEPPDPSECCGNGCDPCVHDLYGERLAEWERQIAALASGVSGDARDMDAS